MFIWMRYCNREMLLPPPFNVLDFIITLPLRIVRWEKWPTFTKCTSKFNYLFKMGVSSEHFTMIFFKTQGWQCPASDEAFAVAVKTSTRAGPPPTRRTTGS